MRVKKVLVVSASGDVRVAAKPRLKMDEVGFNLILDIPDTWGSIVGDLHVTMPEPPEASIEQDGD